MDMMNCRPEMSRRDKLGAHQLNDFFNAWDNTDNALTVHHHQYQPGIILDPNDARNVVKITGYPHNPALIPPGLVGFLQNQIVIPVQTEPVHAYQDCATMFMSVPHGCSNWKSVDPSPLSCDNWAATSYGDVLSNGLNVRNDVLDRSLRCLKPMYDAGLDIALSGMSSSEVSVRDDDKKYHLHHLNQNYNQNNMVTVACSGSTQNDNRENPYEHGSWSGNSRGEFLFLPSYGNHKPDSWMSRPAASSMNQWAHELSSDGTKKSSSLSLSPEVPKTSVISKSSGKSPAGVDVGGGVAAAAAVSSVNVHRHGGPLGPFTGYATILNSSRFLKPAQHLLDEFCSAYVARITCRSEAKSADLMNVSTTEDGKCKDDDSGMLSPTIRSCNDAEGCSSSEPLKPENRLKVAKLNLLQDEVCRRYKLYTHQRQTVVSAFESVAGLSTATPYISLALSRISKSFRSLRIAITDQLTRISRFSGNGCGTKFTDHNDDDEDNNYNSVRKQRYTLCNDVGFLEPRSQHIWRPQRGLPERAVAVLRAWLFDHFLHPYPTDNDKQMLATQTGLSRNQVSNWFINARVRLWKPMVEEMHKLETTIAVASAADTNHNSQDMSRRDTSSGLEGSNMPCNNSSSRHEITSKQPLEQLRGPSSDSDVDGAVEKRPRVEYTRGGNVDVSGLMGFVPCSHQRGGFDNVSLTLGLRHGVDCFPQTQTRLQTQTQTLEHEFGGGQMHHDFVG